MILKSINGGDMGVDDKTLRKFFVSYWLLHSGLYNFAQGLENQRNRRFTWTITNYYYCMVYIGRLFMFLAKNLYFLHHKNVIRFFKGENNIGRVWKLEENGSFREFDISRNQGIENNVNININDITKCIGWNEEKIKKFGKILENLKKFREENTYEAFIIYAQENHSILTDFMMSATETVGDIVKRYLKESCKIFFNYWKNESEDIIKLLGHEWLIPRTLETLKRHNLPYNDIEIIIKQGFFFENSEIYSSNDLKQISKIIEEILPTPLSTPRVGKNKIQKDFERACKFSNFRTKVEISDDALKIFKKLINLKEYRGN